MAMHTGVATSSKVLILVGAGLTGSIILRGGHLSDVISELQELIKGLNESDISSNNFDRSILASQIRRLAEEVRELSLSNPVTIFNGDSGSGGSFANYIMPAAAVGAMGYCYMWWKGWSFSDVMFVTKRNMANAVANASKQLEHVSAALASTKRHLTQRLENLDGKLDDQKEISKLVMNEVTEVKSDISQIGFDIELIQKMVSGLEGKIGLLENTQDSVNAGVWYLCQFVGGMKDKRTAEYFQDLEENHFLEPSSRISFMNFPAKSQLDRPMTTFAEEKSLKGLQFISEAIESAEVGNSKINSTLQKDFHEKPLNKNNITVGRTKIHRSYQIGISLSSDSQVL